MILHPGIDGSKLDWMGYYYFLRHQVGDGVKWIWEQWEWLMTKYTVWKFSKININTKRSDFPIALEDLTLLTDLRNCTNPPPFVSQTHLHMYPCDGQRLMEMSSSTVFLTFEKQSLQEPRAHHLSKASQWARESLPFHLCSAGIQALSSASVPRAPVSLSGLQAHWTEPPPSPTLISWHYTCYLPTPQPYATSTRCSTNWSALKVLLSLKPSMSMKLECNNCFWAFKH